MLALVARGDPEVATIRTGPPAVWVGVGSGFLSGSLFPCLALFFLPGHNYPVSGALGWRFFGTQLGAVRINPGWVGSFQIFRFSVFSFVWSIACARASTNTLQY